MKGARCRTKGQAELLVHLIHPIKNFTVCRDRTISVLHALIVMKRHRRSTNRDGLALMQLVPDFGFLSMGLNCHLISNTMSGFFNCSFLSSSHLISEIFGHLCLHVPHPTVSPQLLPSLGVGIAVTVAACLAGL